MLVVANDRVKLPLKLKLGGLLLRNRGKRARLKVGFVRQLTIFDLRRKAAIWQEAATSARGWARMGLPDLQ